MVGALALATFTPVVPAQVPTRNAAQHPVFDVGSRKQLFIDHKFIESAEGVSLVMNPAVRTGQILIAPDAPWEKNLEIFISATAGNGCSFGASGRFVW